MSFCSEDVPLDYQLFIGAATYLLKRIEADPANGIPKFEQSFVQKGHPGCREVRKHAEWLLRMTQRCCFSVTSFLGALIYIERLRRQRKLALYESTWRSTWVAMSVISEKRWEDNYIHPGHIHNTYGSKHTTLEQQKMQLKLFKALDFNLAIGLDEFSGWITKLRADEKDQTIVNTCHFQRVFIARPIPNLKTRKTQNTPSTSANSESESDSQSETRRSQKQSTSQKLYDAQKGYDAQKSHHPIGIGQQPGGYTTSMTPRAQREGLVRHMPQHGAATCRRDYHSQLSSSQLNCDWGPQHVPELRPGASARDYATGAIRHGNDFSQLDLRLTELRMQELNQQRGVDLMRTSCWHNNVFNAEHHQQQAVYQHRHRIAAQHHHPAVGAQAYDHHGAMHSWTTRALQHDANYQYPRSGVVAWN